MELAKGGEPENHSGAVYFPTQLALYSVFHILIYRGETGRLR